MSRPRHAVQRGAGSSSRRRLERGAGGARLSQPVAEIQITPLIDVLLVLLVLGLMAWVGSRAAGRETSRREASTDLLQGLMMPLRGPTDAPRPVTLGADPLLVGLGAHGQLSWRGAPVTRDILAQQLQLSRQRDPHAEVWLAVDESLAYADLLPWLEWLQAQQVVRLTLLSRFQPTAQTPGKP